ncbi:hypothetical protein [Streptomyces sp. H27-D2]|uniref:hypothetical protein n=1 Tax=Streptomyces sp. H27-D2 TaxID=3046304 RepID=UPI002DC02031|nr:hypothetical protein [Streptomyces sp. H27-D2]MEC4015712.1 hypothetical protein [Streptomyces sp. H27-D2]
MSPVNGEFDGRDYPTAENSGHGQTRTQLPDGESHGFGDTRRGNRSGFSNRNLLTVVAVVVLLIAAIAFANRGGGSAGAGSGGSSDNRDTNRDTAAQPTAPTGEKPVSGKNGGIASGFPKTEQGAQSAAANYAVALGSDGMFKADRRHEIVAAVHDPAVVGKLQGDLDRAYSPKFLANVGLKSDGSAPNGFTFVSRTVPVGSKATKIDGDTATVEVWCTGLVGLAGESSTKPVSETWFTITEKLKWTNDDWKIESSKQTAGPAPVGGDDRASSAEEITNAVEGYGGFTYAR